MSDYQGPAYKDKTRQSMNQRRFNRVQSNQDWRKSSMQKQGRSHQVSTGPVDYQLPEKLRHLPQHQDLVPPVDEEKMDRHIEIKQTQNLEKVSEYQIPWQDKHQAWDPQKAMAKLADPDLSSTQGNKQAKDSHKSAYRPALKQADLSNKQNESPTPTLGQLPSTSREKPHVNASTSGPDFKTKINVAESTMDAQFDRSTEDLNITESMSTLTKSDMRSLSHSPHLGEVKTQSSVQSPSKSIANDQIRQVALRMTKSKDSFLLFEKDSDK